MKRLLIGFTILMSIVISLLGTAFLAEPATVILNVSNTPVRGDVILEKTGLLLKRFADKKDAYGNTVMKPVYETGYLAGAVFELRAAADIVGKEGSVFYHSGDLVQTLTTNTTGPIKSNILPLGKYTIKEVSAPTGYVFSSVPVNFTLSAIDKKTAVVEVKVTASNTFLPVRVTLTKQKEAMKITENANGTVHQTVEVIPGEGFVFGLYNNEVISYGDNQKLPANTLVATAATNDKGELTFSGLYPHGTYTIRELSVPSGWKKSNEPWTVTLTSAQKSASENVIVASISKPILNELIYTPVTLTKTDITGANKLPGALIEVRDSNNKVVYREYTDANGEIPDIPVVPGKYTFRETYAPEGYALNVAEMTFTVTADGKVIGDIEIRDEINEIYLKKIKENGEILPGAVFGLFDSNNQKIQEATADVNGIVVFRKIGYGDYVIRELSAPYGYHPSAEEWKFHVDGTYVNPDREHSTVTNEVAPGRIRITKLNELDAHPIADVVFDIYATNADGTPGDLIGNMVTDSTGVAESVDLFAADYIVIERANPIGYEGDLWKAPVTVEMDKVTDVTVTNKPIQGVIRIIKTDSETKSGLPGAVFTVIRLAGLPSHNGEGDGEVVATIITDESGHAETPLLTWGKYQVTETTVPDDYLDDSYTTTVFIPADSEAYFQTQGGNYETCY